MRLGRSLLDLLRGIDSKFFEHFGKNCPVALVVAANKPPDEEIIGVFEAEGPLPGELEKLHNWILLAHILQLRNRTLETTVMVVEDHGEEVAFDLFPVSASSKIGG